VSWEFRRKGSKGKSKGKSQNSKGKNARMSEADRTILFFPIFDFCLLTFAF